MSRLARHGQEKKRTLVSGSVWQDKNRSHLTSSSRPHTPTPAIPIMPLVSGARTAARRQGRLPKTGSPQSSGRLGEVSVMLHMSVEGELRVGRLGFQWGYVGREHVQQVIVGVVDRGARAFGLAGARPVIDSIECLMRESPTVPFQQLLPANPVVEVITGAPQVRREA